MNLKFDPVDVVGAGCWDTISRLFLFATSVMVGCGIGSWALHAHHMFDDPWEPILYFIIGPAHLLSAWALISFPLLLAGLFMMIRSEEELAPRWAALASILGLLCVVGYFRDFNSRWLPWVLWLVMSAMLCTATWFWMQWHRNRWIQEIEEIKAENHQRRQELHDKFGTVSTNMYDIDET